MNLKFSPLSEIEEHRTAWFVERAKPAMKLDEYWRLNEDAYRLFPLTVGERRAKFKRMKDMPEFVL